MSDRIRIVVDEDAGIVARLDELAEIEGLSRADILRRAIRRLLFSLPTVPEIGINPKEGEQVAA